MANKNKTKRLSREKMVTALEDLYEFDTGLTPPITYDPNRRIGARGERRRILDAAHAGSIR